MKSLAQKIGSLSLALALLCSTGITAAASEALGEDLTAKDTLLHEETALSTNVFWSTTFSDLRRENLITYTPGDAVTPIVTYGDALTDRSTVSAMAKRLEAEGYRVVAGLNGDFYNVGTGLPIGLVIGEGELRSSDGGYFAMGFREDGTAVLGKPGVKVTADLGYAALDNYDVPTQVVRQLAGVNKARVSTGGIYLYTYDFNAKRTTGNTEAGVDVICTIQEGSLSVGESLTVTVEEIREATAGTPIAPDQVVLSANLLSTPFHVDALRRIPLGTEITLSVTANEGWEDVQYGLGALYSLVEYGGVVAGLPKDVSPRTAVGQKADGTLVFYTIDGRKSGHSIGASMTQVAQRLIELGCETALCLDGGGSTTLSVTKPDATAAATVNRPSDSSERAVSNQIFLVADGEPTGRLSHFYVTADNQYVLAGSRVNITASAVDTAYFPMDRDYDLDTDRGDLDGNVLTTPSRGGEITVTASDGGKEGSTTVYAVTDPDAISVKSGGAAVTNLTVTPGSVNTLTASAMYRHQALKADPEAFTWTVSGDIGEVDSKGVFTAATPGAGSITVSAGGKSATINVTVSRMALHTVEDFEATATIFDGYANDATAFSRATNGEYVRLGRGSGKLAYTMNEGQELSTEWYFTNPTTLNGKLYTSLNLWVYGDNSGNKLSLLYNSDEAGYLAKEVAILDFTGWKQVTVSLADTPDFILQGLRVSADGYRVYDDGLGNLIEEYPDNPRSGVIYLDHLVGAFAGTVDNAVPAVTAALDKDAWQVTATVSDAVDGVLAQSAVTASYNGAPTDFVYDAKTGKVTVALPAPGESYEAMRVTITAKDASGNIGRASVDVEALGVAHKFTDLQDYWAATFVNFLYNSGITTGYDDGTFRPNQNITRAQFSVMLYRYLGLEESRYADVTLPFADNAAIPEYAVPAIRALYTEGVINGSTGKDGQLYFNPGSSLTRAQAATMIGRTQEKGYATTELTFVDAGKIPAYATFYIQTMAAQGVIGGYTDGTFKPGSPITRGQMAKILYNLL